LKIVDPSDSTNRIWSSIDSDYAGFVLGQNGLTKGRLQMWGGDHYVNIIPANITATRTITLPNEDGTIALQEVHNIKHYKTLAEIGITKGSETLTSIRDALPNNSILQCEIGSGHNQDIYPAGGYGTLIVNKVNISRCYFEFHAHQTNAHYYATTYKSSDKDILTDWEKVSLQHDHPYLELSGGTMSGPILRSTFPTTWVGACNG